MNPLKQGCLSDGPLLTREGTSKKTCDMSLVPTISDKSTYNREHSHFYTVLIATLAKIPVSSKSLTKAALQKKAFNIYYKTNSCVCAIDMYLNLCNCLLYVSSVSLRPQ